MLRTTVTSVGETLVVALAGDLDLAAVSSARTALRAAVERSRDVAVDLDGVEVLDSTGLGVLLGAARRARSGHGELRIVATDPRITRILELSGVDRAIEVLDALVGD